MKVATGLIVAGLLLFGASFTHPFHFDDWLITNDSNVTNPARLAHFFNPFHLRQLTFFSFYLNHLAGGLDPAGYHAVNVILHIANAVLLFLLLRRFVEHWIAAAAAALFLVHPLQTEAVLYVYQRSILLACLFSLLGLLALAKGRPMWAILSFFLAFESKEASLAVPLVAALLVIRPRWREIAVAENASRVMESRGVKFAMALCLLAVVLAAFAIGVLWEEKTVGLNAGLDPLRYLVTESRVIYTYLRLLVFPYPQSLEYDFQNAGGILTIAGLAAILVCGWMWKSLSVVAFFLLLAPTSSIIPSIDAAFEHRLYLPMLAFSLLAAFLIARLPQRTVVCTVLLIALSLLTIRREAVWSSDVALWEDATKRAPNKARAWFNLGGAYLASDPEKSRQALLRALDLQPEFPEAFYDLGVIEQDKKNWAGAIAYYQRALELNPGYWAALNNMGNTFFAMGDLARSVDSFERTLRLNPDYWPAQYNIAIVHFRNGRYADAIAKLTIVLDWRPEFREARYLLATSLSRTGNRNQADLQWQKLAELNAAESRHTPTMILAPSRP